MPGNSDSTERMSLKNPSCSLTGKKQNPSNR